MPKSDPIFSYIRKEQKRQREVIDLIPSENHASPDVRRAVGSVLMHKYAEGYPRKRYYQGNDNADSVEQMAKDRALAAFDLNSDEWGVNVQAYSGSPANVAIYNALLKPGDKIMAMYLPDGGHLSHGWHFGQFSTFVDKIFKITFYHVDKEKQVFDYEEILKQAKKVKPNLLISGGTAYPREINHKKMGEIARKVGAYYLADVSHEAGLIAAGVNGSPFSHADAVMCTTHKTLRGPRGALIFARKASRLKADQGKDLSELVDRSIFPGFQGGPHLHTIAGIAIALEETRSSKFKKYAKQILTNAKAFADYFSKRGYKVVSGGTDKHLVLLDLRGSGVEAWIAAWVLEYAGIILNRNTVPNETGSPYYPSGIRLGTPIITTRGMKVREVKQIAAWIHEVMQYSRQWQIPEDKVKRKKFLKDFKRQIEKDKYLADLKKQVKRFAKGFAEFSR